MAETLGRGKQRLTIRPTEELFAMESCTAMVIQSGKTTIEYVVWHAIHSEDIEYNSAEEANTLSAQLDRKLGVRRPQCITHSFILQTSRNVFLCLQRNYLSGFSLDEGGRVVPISDEVLYAYD